MAARFARSIVIVLLAAICGCAAHRQQVRYELDDVPQLSGGPWSGYSLGVVDLVDTRAPEVKSRRGDVLEPAWVTREGDDWYVNGDDHYESPLVAASATVMLIDHLRSTRVFKDVLPASTATGTDLTLSGELRQLDGYVDRQAGTQAVASQGGLLGLVVGTTTSARYDASVQLTNLRLVETASSRVLWEGQVEATLKGETPLIVSNHWYVYSHANAALKMAVGKLVDRLVAVPPPTAPAADAVPVP
jgi:hypothetical protein